MTCCTLTGVYGHDNLVKGKESEASCAALFSAALGSGETAHHLATAALEQLSAELTILDFCLCNGGGVELNVDILRSVINGLSERARVAAEVAGRIRAVPVAEQVAAARKGVVTP